MPDVLDTALDVVRWLGVVGAALYGIRKGARAVMSLIRDLGRAVDLMEIASRQLMPNDGESLVDRVERIESKLDEHLEAHHVDGR